MHKWLLFLAVLAAARADDAVLALTIRAQADFDRVEAEPFPGIQDVTRCSQTQAQLLPVARPAELPLVRFRKGYCELLEARMTRHRGDYQRAAQDFAQALAAWPARGVEPLSSGLQVLSAVARLEAGADAAERDGIRAGLRDALSREACPAGVMSARFCQELVRTGRLWQGWMALGDGDSRAAEEIFREFPDLAWSAWMAGRQALREHRYTQAAAAFRKTVEAWSREARYPRPGVLHTLGPPPALEEATAELGGALYLAGDGQGALSTFETVVKERPEDARAVFFRGLAHQALGQPAAALNDYQFASRMAFAHPERPDASAEAHLYRGVWHFRRKAWAQAENEFASALNAAPGPALRPDIVAWRFLAAVAGGSCQAAAAGLRDALPAASGWVPKAEAEALLSACPRPPGTLGRQ